MSIEIHDGDGGMGVVRCGEARVLRAAGWRDIAGDDLAGRLWG